MFEVAVFSVFFLLLTVGGVVNHLLIPVVCVTFFSFLGVRLHEFGLNLDLGRVAVFVAVMYVICVVLAGRRVNKFALIYFGVGSVFIVIPLLLFLLRGDWFFDYGYSLLQQPHIRPLVQFFMRESTLLMLILPFILKGDLGSSLLIKGVVLGTTIQCLLSLYQLVGILFLLPVWDYPMGVLQYVAGLPRVSGLAGEPRHLAFLLIPTICYCFSRLLRSNYSVGLGSKKIFFLLLLHALCLTLTFSTSGYVLLFISLVFTLLFSINLKKSLFAFLLIAPIVGLALSTAREGGLVEERLLARVSVDSFIRSEFSSAAAIEYVYYNPMKSFLGLGAGATEFYIREMPSYVASYSNVENSVLSNLRTASGILALLLEYGVPCFIILLIMISFNWKKSRFDDVGSNELSGVSFVFLISIFITGVVGAGPLTPYFWLFFGMNFRGEKTSTDFERV